ncbi:hypothetical protein ACQ4LE_000992 [Meloidogyne hapla]|uniref:ELMO domain-containing protein n=1 Tax=Meloidogyne hapla TaxID=6305 RepID=A0A1I8B600_MELHA
MWSFIKSLFRSIFNFFYRIYQNIINCFARKQTIEDIILKEATRASKNRRIEKMLKEFPNELVQSMAWDTGDETEAAEAILEESVLDDDKRLDLSKTLARSMRQIKGYQKLCQEVEHRRLEVYCNKIPEHEKELLRLWALLKPNEPLISRLSNQWQDIGFQGDDPSTDFRGMGILGLDQLVFFAQYDVDNCRRVFSLSLHPVYGFPFAICGITITALCKELLFDDLLKNHFYNVLEQPPLKMDHFHQVYCCVFRLFADYWEWEKPESVMQFNLVKRRFVKFIEEYLENSEANLIVAKIEDFKLEADTN